MGRFPLTVLAVFIIEAVVEEVELEVDVVLLHCRYQNPVDKYLIVSSQ